MSIIPKEFPFGSLHNVTGWKCQFARTARWLNRLMTAKSPEEAEDFLYTFFQNCYHLKDWVLGELDLQDVDSFINSSLPLRICRDVANLTKHSSLERKAAQTHELSIVREYAGANAGWFEQDTRLAIVTNYKNNGIVIDAREVARECMRLWCSKLPNCPLVESTELHFHLSAIDFQRVLSETEAKTLWAKNLTKP